MRKRRKIVYSTEIEAAAAQQVCDDARAGRILALPETEEIVRPPIEVLMERQLRNLLSTFSGFGDPPFGYSGAYYVRALRQQRAFRISL